MARLFVYAALSLIVSISSVRCQGSDYDDYDYGDLTYHFDSVHESEGNFVSKGGNPGYEPLPPQAVRGAGGVSGLNPPLPLCCKQGEVYDLGRCTIAPLKFSWKPKLDGAMDPKFEYRGFPKCKNQANYVAFYQKEIHFNQNEGSALLPFYIQMQSVNPRSYCIAKVMEDHQCEDFLTHIFACIKEDETTLDIVWIAVTISHILIFLTILVFIFFAELRSLQGFYMICFLISLFIYNICLLPGSQVVLKIGDIMCIALGAVKYFFFSGIFLWFNIICFDVWRTIRAAENISSRKRFLFYSIFCWISAAILTVSVLVLPYIKEGGNGNSRLDPLREANYSGCKLKMGVDLILQITQTLSMFASFIMMVLATVSFYGYKCYGNGLARSEANICIKQAWKLFMIMVAHLVFSIDPQFMPLPIPMYQCVLLESVAIFSVFSYRKMVKRWVIRGACFSRWMNPETDEAGSSQEKGQLTLT